MSEEIAYWQHRVATLESQLGVAHQDLIAAQELTDRVLREALKEMKRQQMEIMRLTAALRQAARMRTIRGARRIVEDTLGKEPPNE